MMSVVNAVINVMGYGCLFAAGVVLTGLAVESVIGTVKCSVYVLTHDIPNED